MAIRIAGMVALVLFTASAVQATSAREVFER
jgi:hypothetical protein